MYSNIALNNVRKSFKDYTIYFLTLTFAVAIFYSFNTLGDQNSMVAINSSTKDYMKTLSQIMGIISIFVSVILCGLILYANNFLIKRRKKELGIYMYLGMSKRKISKILVFEELIIGIFSLIAGLILGIVLSQGLSLITAKLFEVSLDKYKFIVSMDSVIKTAIYFGIIFLLVMIFNTIVISRYKLIDLLTAHKKNEKIKIKNPIISGVIFLVSIVMIGYAYYLVLKTGLDIINLKFKISIVLGIVGTILFFYGLTSFLILIIQKNKKIYLRKLNIFTLRQMNSKINTNFISMAVICLMLFLTISILSVGVSFKRQNIDSTTPFDATVIMYAEKSSKTLENVLKENKFNLPNGYKASYVTVYKLKNTTKDTLYKYGDTKVRNNVDKGFNSNLSAVSISDYNKVRKLKGEKPLNLKDNEVAIQCNMSILKPTLEKLIKESGKIKIDGKEYKIYDEKIIDKSLQTSMVSGDFEFIVPDDLIKGLSPEQYILNINYGNDKKASEDYITNFFENNIKKTKDGFLMLSTKNEVMEAMKGTTVMILYVVLYLGIIFLISSAAVLALQQLSEASDSADRYNSLRRIGAPNSMINKSIFIQTLAYFMLPLVLGIVHSIVGICVASDFIELFGRGSIVESSLITMGAIIIIYGGYFVTTYISYKNIVKKI